MELSHSMVEFRFVDEIAGLPGVHELALPVTHLHEVVVDHVLAVVDALALLPFGARAEELAAGARGRAAGHALLLTITTSPPASLTSMAAARPPAPAPQTTTSNMADLVLILGRHGAGGGSGARLCPPRDAPAAARAAETAPRDGLAGDVRARYRGDVEALVFDYEPGEALDGRGVQPQAMPRYSRCLVIFTLRMLPSETSALT